MSNRIEKNLFILSSRLRLYQQIAPGVANYKKSGNHILECIRAAQSFRQVEQVKELADVLVNTPIKEYRLIGRYYNIWCNCRESKFDSEALERIIDETEIYKVKALSSRGTFEWYKGNNEAAFYFYNEALSASPTISEYIDLSKAIAVLKAQEGFHKSAVEDLEKLLPIIRYAEPIVRNELLNSLAVELGEVGQIQEALVICNRTLASPFAFAYPEWLETRFDLLRRGCRAGCFSAIKQKKVPGGEIVNLPVREQEMPILKPDEPARVLKFIGRGQRVGEEAKEPSEDAQGVVGTRREIVDLLYEYGENIGPGGLAKILESVKKAIPKREEQNES
ncbi:MAG: hypothetical protein WBV94_06885 [Blastocatellia bacterium]